MKNAISNGALVAIAAGAMLLSSCGDKDLYNSNYKYDEYAANWESRFGQIDPNQDWSMATTVTATVNVGREGTFSVKVYSSDPSDDTQQAYLLGKAVVEGGSPVTLTFDAAKNLDNVYVALITEQNLGIIKKVAIENGNVNADFFITSAAKAKTRTADTGGWEYTDPVDFPIEYIKNTLLDSEKGLVEEVDAGDKMCNYEFESNGEFIIYPVYTKTSGSDQIGYYYYDPKTQTIDQRTEVSFIENLQKYRNMFYKWGENNYEAIENHNGGSSWIEWNFLPAIRSVGIAINVPQGYRVGFWVMNSDVSETRLYSNRILNSDGCYYSAVGTNKDGTLYFGLEDWKQQGGHVLDCNDIVFFVKNAGDNKLPDPVPPTPTLPDDSEDKTMSWLLACEDLGSTDDYDFNDIVVEVSRVDSYTNNAYQSSKLVVKCLAAGGTLPARIYYDDTLIGESHDMLGAENTTQMINTMRDITKTSRAVEITEGITRDWTLSANSGKFTITVEQETGNNDSRLIEKPETGNAPQMIIVPGAWRWPTERTNIEDAYPDFTNWSANATFYDWMNKYVDDKLIDR